MLEQTYSDAADVPSEYAAIYTEIDGTYTLIAGDQIKTVEDTTKLQESLTKSRAEFKEAKAQLKAFDGMDAETVQATLDEVESLRLRSKENSNVDELVKAEVDLVKKSHERELQKLRVENETLAGTVNEFETNNKKALVKDAVTNALTEGNVLPDAQGDLLQLANALFEVNADGAVVMSETGTTPEDWIESKKQSSSYLFAPSESAGLTGNEGNSTSTANPFDQTSEHYNLTAAVAMKKENPAQAARMEKIADANMAKAAKQQAD